MCEYVCVYVTRFHLLKHLSQAILRNAAEPSGITAEREKGEEKEGECEGGRIGERDREREGEKEI